MISQQVELPELSKYAVSTCNGVELLDDDDGQVEETFELVEDHDPEVMDCMGNDLDHNDYHTTRPCAFTPTPRPQTPPHYSPTPGRLCDVFRLGQP